jgi:hypothetical protein
VVALTASGRGVGDQFRIHYDLHAILRPDTRQHLKDQGYGFLIGGFP